MFGVWCLSSEVSMMEICFLDHGCTAASPWELVNEIFILPWLVPLGFALSIKTSISQLMSFLTFLIPSPISLRSK